MKKTISVFFTLVIIFFNTNFSFASENCGIGVDFKRLGHDYSYPTITKVFDNSPASTAGIVDEDRIIEVDGQDTLKMSIDQIGNNIKGVKGSRVKILVQRDGKNELCTVTRDNYKVPMALYAPKWEEFCPSEFVKAKHREIYKYQPTKIEGLMFLTIVGIPYVLNQEIKYCNKIAYIARSNYWVERRTTFENEIKSCLADENSATMCFMQVRQMEDNKNAQIQKDQASYDLQNQIQAQQN